MKNLLFFALLLLMSPLFGQDLIVKTTDDSLNCLVTRTENGHTFFNQIVNHRLKRDSLSAEEIKEIKIAYYSGESKATNLPTPVAKVPTQPANNRQVVVTVDKPYQAKKVYNDDQKIMLSAYVGFSNRTAVIPPDLDKFLQDYYQDLKKGGCWGFEGAYFINENIGLGLVFSQHFSRAEVRNVGYLDTTTNTVVTGKIREEVKISYLAPAIYFRLKSNDEKSIFMGNMSLGKSSYFDKAEWIDEFFTIKGSDVGLSLGGTYNYMIDPSLALGFGIDYKYSNIYRLTFNNGTFMYTTDEFIEDISRVDFRFMITSWF